MEDLAEQGVDDLMDIEGMTEERAGELIMTARAPGSRKNLPDRPPRYGSGSEDEQVMREIAQWRR
jgi:hypothetical protein